MITRRTAVVAAGGTLALAACGTPPARILAGDPRDLRVLAAALDVERRQIAFYEQGVGLSPAKVLRTILGQEHAHAAAIEEAIRELGGTPAPARPIAHAAIHRSYAAWRQEAMLREAQWSAGYAALIPKLVNQDLRGTFGALATTEAEHAVALDVAG